VERLVVVLGDQLDADAAVLRTANPERDAVLMAEVDDEATHVPSHRQRTTLFLSAMRHFADTLVRRKWRVRYVSLDDSDNSHTLVGEIQRAAQALAPKAIALTLPGEHRVQRAVATWSRRVRGPVELVPDGHFLTDLEAFAEWRRERRRPVMEHFYRAQRKRLGILLDHGGGPQGGSWNFDASNRQAFASPPRPPQPPHFAPDRVTRDVIEAVVRRFPDAPGRLDSFGWPVTRQAALQALSAFVDQRLASFGPFQDAMWTGQRLLYHSALSPALNLKLLHPREVVNAALAALDKGAPLPSVEGFVRQVIGWREFIRGVYWTEGPEYGARNALEHEGRLPSFYWTGETDMRCMAESVRQVLDTGYGHHIQRLMVTGNFALLAGVHPKTVADWYLGMFVDGVDWVTLPNALGMVMHADGGVVGTKPYAASGKYIDRMSNYCKGCRYDPAKRTGDDACPFTTFYWDFLSRNQRRFAGNPRMSLMLRHVERTSRGERSAIATHARTLRRTLGIAAT
jgi:deoxyribodipyrimidine photolyase-related protein